MIFMKSLMGAPVECAPPGGEPKIRWKFPLPAKLG
jgi:hypothetical protein